MTLIKSISGIRGTIGGGVSENLTPIDIVKFAAAYADWLRGAVPTGRLKVVVGRDARPSGEMVAGLIVSTLLGCGVDVVDIGLASTPTTELAVTGYGAQGGIIVTASHNPKQWNALKLLNARGEFLNDTEGKKILALAEAEAFDFAPVDDLGAVVERTNYDEEHIRAVLELPFVDAEAIRQAKFKVVVDAVNSVGGVVIPQLLAALGVETVCLNCIPDGQFAHNPEPLAENLTEIAARVVQEKTDLGIVVDPDVDRLALINEDGTMFGEEYTLVAVADYVLSQQSGATVSNLSSTRALRDIARTHGVAYAASAVGEVNVVAKMKETGAVIGGEGNGGVIYPASHYGRDALVGVALFLTLLAKSGKTMTALRAGYPPYFMSKNKVQLTPGMDVDGILSAVKQRYAAEEVTDIDGVKIDFADGWVHLRKSNTEPIIRLYSEGTTPAEADRLAQEVMGEIKRISSQK
ncbi:MAG: phosphoglucosamine mutase [Rikenellaceae bacterium]|jgi:phosphomannomutase|nr:phosphoglucosamine mutase [Rikenellaceae bacterium]